MKTPAYLSLLARYYAMKKLVDKASHADAAAPRAVLKARITKHTAIAAAMDTMSNAQGSDRSKLNVEFYKDFCYFRMVFSPAKLRSLYLAGVAKSYQQLYEAVSVGYPGLCREPAPLGRSRLV